MYNILLDAPCLGEREQHYLHRAINEGYVSSVGPFIPEFEERFSRSISANKSVAVMNGTIALHMSLRELAVGPGDEVIVPVLTFVASVNPVTYVGARPVFVDVDPNTWNLDPAGIENCITKNTKAIIPVHLYGNPCAMDKIQEIAEGYNLFVIEDAAESLGALYNGKHTGTFGDFGCFSFNGNKVITTGGGGMITSPDESKLKHIKYLVNQARDEGEVFFHSEIGYNYRMTNIQAALGLAQMEKLDAFLEKKRKFNTIYRNELAGIPGILFQKEYPGASSSFWMTAVTFSFKKDFFIQDVIEKLRERGIQTRRIFPPIVEFPPYHQYKIGSYPNAYQIFNNGICLSVSTRNSEYDIYTVCSAIKEIAANYA